jgi:CDP-4-dehydro-6-deoxyglucose reductase
LDHKLTIWRAAQLIGVARRTLQKDIKQGNLAISDGMVSVSDLLKLYPDLKLEKTGLLESVAHIKNEAFAKRVRERVLPSQDVLSRRLFDQTQELADTRRLLQRYHSMVMATQDQVLSILNQSFDKSSYEKNVLSLQTYLQTELAKTLATEQADTVTVIEGILKLMSSEVTIKPSGHQFLVEGVDSLLQAGLKAGLKLNYGCGNGTCGMCKARVISGEVIKIHPSDYHMSQAETLQRYTLMCATAPASEVLTLEVLESSDINDIPEQHLSTKIREVRPLTNDIVLLHLQTSRSHRLRFWAGQSVLLSISKSPGHEVSSSYSIASCPCDDRNLHFFIERNPSDDFSKLIFSGELKSGSEVALWGPHGEFTLSSTDQSLVFLACDNGFAPIKSLIEEALAVDQAQSIFVGWLATRLNGHYLKNQCRSWKDALDHFDFECLLTEEIPVGAMSLMQVIGHLENLQQSHFYVCGPDAFVTSCSSFLADIGILPSQLKLSTLK